MHPDRITLDRQHWRALLRRHAIRPNKKLGQHFLVERWALNKVIAAADLEGAEVVLEIGAGVGALTRALSEIAGRVIAVELDRRLIPALHETVAPLENVEVRVGDALELDLAEAVAGRRYSVVANIPYYITSALIRKLMEADRRPRQIVLTVQDEVARRITAEPGQMSLLALSVQIYGEPSVEAQIPRTAFFPTPEVDSAVLRIDVSGDLRISSEVIEAIFALAKAGFGQRRKQLRNALASGLPHEKRAVESWLAQAGLPETARAQELSLVEWQSLAEQLLQAERFSAG